MFGLTGIRASLIVGLLVCVLFWIVAVIDTREPRSSSFCERIEEVVA